MSERTRRNFIRLAEKRVSRAINDIRLIGNLSDRSNYDYSDDQVQKIFSALRHEMTTCRNRFGRSERMRRASSFRLADRDAK
jgi:transcription elongation GreA/GreB family factor